MKNNATAIWRGNGADGTGELNTKSNTLKKTRYSYKSRVEDGNGTNPEELVAAAHAGCFAMKLAFTFESAGYVADELITDCEITYEAGAIVSSHIHVVARVKGIAKAEFDELVADSGQNCPISKLLNTKVVVTAELKN